MSASKKTEAVLVRTFLQSVGAHLGLYNAKTKSFVEDLESTDHYQQNLEQLSSFLKKGWKASEVEEEIWAAYRRHEKAARFHEILPDKAPAKKVDERENLLEPGFVYQHPALYSRSNPTYGVSKSGVLVKVLSGHSTAKESFTLRDLAEYYFKNMRVGNTPGTWSSSIGAFVWLLGEARVDEILTAIDKASEADDETPVIKLVDFLREAKNEVRTKEARMGE